LLALILLFLFCYSQLCTASHPWIKNYDDTKVPLDILIFKLMKAYMPSSSVRKNALRVRLFILILACFKKLDFDWKKEINFDLEWASVEMYVLLLSNLDFHYCYSSSINMIRFSPSVYVEVSVQIVAKVDCFPNIE